MFDIGFFELLLILGIAAVVVGPKNLPRVARSIGRGWADFQRTFNELKEEVLDEAENLQKEINVAQLEQDIVTSTKIDVDVNLNLDDPIDPQNPEGKSNQQKAASPPQ